MKRLLVMGSLLVAFSVAFAGCSGSSSSTPSPSPTPSPSGVIYQNFEGSSATFSSESWGLWGATATLSGTHTHGGSKALQLTTTSNNAGGLKVICNDSWSIDLSSATKISLYIYGEPVTSNWYGIKLGISDNSSTYAEVWSDNTQLFVPNQWTKITIPFSSLVPTSGTINYSNINSILIEFTNQGVYYIDDIVAEP